MAKIKTKVISAEVGKYECDSITVKIEDSIVDIGFDKKVNTPQYVGKEIYLINNNGNYSIELCETKVFAPIKNGKK